jgi:hypothetical protein
MSELEVTEVYLKGNCSLRKLSKKCGLSTVDIKKILEKNNIPVIPVVKDQIFTKEHKNRISESCMGRKVWNEGKTITRKHLINNIISHLKYDVKYEWVDSFEDLNKFMFLSRSVRKERDTKGFLTETYIEFIEKFYIDEKFNQLYSKYILTKDKWIRPSLDHIIPKSKGGQLHLVNNLQFISWFENRAKYNMSQSEWDNMKLNLSYYL